jgi:hypothetical protein
MTTMTVMPAIIEKLLNTLAVIFPDVNGRAEHQ